MIVERKAGQKLSSRQCPVLAELPPSFAEATSPTYQLKTQLRHEAIATVHFCKKGHASPNSARGGENSLSGEPAFLVEDTLWTLLGNTLAQLLIPQLCCRRPVLAATPGVDRTYPGCLGWSSTP